MNLDAINKPSTGLVGIGLVALSLLPNPQFQAAVVTFFSHPTPPQVISAIGTIAGIVTLYISKPLFTSPAPPKEDPDVTTPIDDTPEQPTPHPDPVPVSSGPTGPKHPDPDTQTTIDKLNEIRPQLSPILQKLLTFVIGLLTGIGGDFSVSGNYTKEQTGAILGTTYNFTETVDGSADVKAVPQ